MQVHSTHKIEKIKEFRRDGMSINDIVKTLGIPKTTVWHHVKDIKLSEEQCSRLKKGSVVRSNREWDRSKQDAKDILSGFGSKQHKAILLSSLYWAEGAKKDFNLNNTDPKMVRVFVSCLKELGANEDDLTYGIRIFEDMNKDKVISFWSNYLNVPRSKFKYISILKGKKEGKLEHGMCRVRLSRGGYFLKLMHSMRELISENIK